WSAAQRYVLASIAVGHPFVATRFREAVDGLLAQGFLRSEGADLRIGPGLVQAWILGERLAHAQSEDPWRDWIGPEDRSVPLQASDKQAWVRAVRGKATRDEPPPSRAFRPVERRRARLFVSYSHHDERYRERLEGHLAALRREDLVEIWHDQRI